MRVGLTLIAMIIFFVLSYFCIGTEIAYKDSVEIIDVERDTPDSVRIKLSTPLNHYNAYPGVIIKETDDNILLGLVHCGFYQICLVDAGYDHGRIRIKNKGKPIKIRYRQQFKNGSEENWVDQIWP